MGSDLLSGDIYKQDSYVTCKVPSPSSPFTFFMTERCYLVIVTLCPQWIFFYIAQKPDQTSAVRRSLQVLAIIWEVFSLSPAILVTSRNTSS